MLIKKFLFHLSPTYFPGHQVTKPFYLSVEYSYDKYGHFIEVLNVEMSFKAVGCIVMNGNLAAEIEAAARNNFENTVKKAA